MTKLLEAFIRYYLQCLPLQTRNHLPYSFLQPINLLPMTFNILVFKFMLVLPLSARGFNFLMSVMCKFFRCMALIEGEKTWWAKKWVYALLQHLNFIKCGLFSKLTTNKNLKFLGKFWKIFFIKLVVKLLYSIVYYAHINSFNKHKNQIIEITLRFFMHMLDNLVNWPKIILQIQLILNNTSSISTGKTSNKVIYAFIWHCLLDSFNAFPFS